ncbi:kinase-like domain-containing protein [Phycomyces nitens]|nr:kinase-like domain-containing protein [Phycomyces nitens]
MFNFPQKPIEQSQEEFSTIFDHLIRTTKDKPRYVNDPFAFGLPSPKASPCTSPLPSPSPSHQSHYLASSAPSSTLPCTRKTCLTRRSASVASSQATTWSRPSPAASFLASFNSPPKITQEEEGDEMDDYVFDKIIGYGGFSTVRKGYRISDGQKVAVKIIKKSTDDEDQIRTEREINIWKSLEHPNIVKVQNVLETDYATYIVADYCANGHLLDLLHTKSSLSELEAKKIFVPLVKSIAYLHNQAKVCHKDIKLENVLLDECGTVKLCDFGLAVAQQPSINNESEVAGGSLAYAAPEQIRSGTALGCPKTDIWSLGIVLYAIVSGQLPFTDSYAGRLQEKILSGQWDPLPTSLNLSPEFYSLLKGCLCMDPVERLSADQILSSPWCT